MNLRNDVLCSPAWLSIGLLGLGNEPGVLELADGRISFRTEDERVFEVPVSQVETAFPWYYFGGGCKLRIGSKWHRISFVRPNGAGDVSARLLPRAEAVGAGGDAAALLTIGRKAMDISEGRQAGMAWRAALAERPSTPVGWT